MTFDDLGTLLITILVSCVTLAVWSALDQLFEGWIGPDRSTKVMKRGPTVVYPLLMSEETRVYYQTHPHLIGPFESNVFSLDDESWSHTWKMTDDWSEYEDKNGNSFIEYHEEEPQLGYFCLFLFYVFVGVFICGACILLCIWWYMEYTGGPDWWIPKLTDAEWAQYLQNIGE